MGRGARSICARRALVRMAIRSELQALNQQHGTPNAGLIHLLKRNAFLGSRMGLYGTTFRGLWNVRDGGTLHQRQGGHP